MLEEPGPTGGFLPEELVNKGVATGSGTLEALLADKIADRKSCWVCDGKQSVGQKGLAGRERQGKRSCPLSHFRSGLTPRRA